MEILRESLTLPLRDAMLEKSGTLTRPWEWFFRTILDRVKPLGTERVFPVANNQSSAADVTGLRFDSRQVTSAIVEYLVQRVTTSTGATELVESGIFAVTFKPTSNTWSLHTVSVDQPQNSGVTFSVTSSGQVQYTSTNITGTASISNLFYRARTLGGKNHQFSQMAGGR